MTLPEDFPEVRQEDEGVSDPGVRHAAELRDIAIREQREQEESRRWLRLIIPVAAVLWLALIVYVILNKFITGVQVGIALGATGAALLGLLGIQVSWAYGGRRKSSSSASEGLLPSHLKRED